MKNLQALARALGDAKVVARVTLAEDDPAAYVAKHAKELAERGITKPGPRLAFVALLDALEANKRVALIDHRAAPDDEATCGKAYIAHVEQLRAEGWQQLDADNHAKAVRAARRR